MTDKQEPAGNPEGAEPVVDDLIAERVRAMAEVARRESLAELTVAEDGLEISIRLDTEPPVVVTGAMLSGPQPAGADEAEAADGPEIVDEPGIHLVAAPMVGVFYRAPMPDAPPFVAEGDHIAPGDVIGLVEAMKIFNEVQADVGGRVGEYLVENEAFVRLGQPLLKLRTDA